ncbi:MAG: hypothetical protein M0Z82_05485 [Actinomycetota bacterium]|nr:hypothetical protein [Actinomycetota bacterium]
MRRLVDLGLDALAARARRRAGDGERVWVAVMVALWLVRRSRHRRGTTVWQGALQSGQHLSVTVRSPSARRRSRAR